MSNDWKLVDHNTPERIPIMTKIDNGKGCRNEQVMERCGNLWWIDAGKPGEMYVYYCPTHWKSIEAVPNA